MIKKNSKTRKAKLKADKSELLDKLNSLLQEGKKLFEQPKIDEKKYDYWYDRVIVLLKNSFSNPDNEYKNRFVLPVSYIFIRHDSESIPEIDLQFELRKELGEELSNLDIIINDIIVRY